MERGLNIAAILGVVIAFGLILAKNSPENHKDSLLNVSYARSAAATFALAETGDVHLTWENEALREVDESNGRLELVFPPVSILAEPYVAWVDANVQRHGTELEARRYLEFLFSDAAQRIIAQRGYRPYKSQFMQNNTRLAPISLFPVTAIARDWADAQEKFFADNGIIDIVLHEKRP